MSGIKKPGSIWLYKYSRDYVISRRTLAITALLICALLSLASSTWGGLFQAHFPTSSAKAAAPSTALIHIPYFTTAVPFNQTAIFLFGEVTSTNTYTDVRIGYNSSELYVDLQIVDHYWWYDTNTSAPNVNVGDNASVYLETTPGGSSLLAGNSYKFQAAVNGYKQRNNYQQAYSGNGMAWTAARIPFTAVYGWRGHGFNGPQDSGWSMTYHIPFRSLGLSSPPHQGNLWKLAVKVHNRDDAANTPFRRTGGRHQEVRQTHRRGEMFRLAWRSTSLLK
jgi:hypothetical protein